MNLIEKLYLIRSNRIFCILLLLLSSLIGSKTDARKGVTVNCIHYDKIYYHISIYNGSDSSIYLPEKLVIQEGTDTLWADFSFSYEHNYHLIYTYKIDDTIFKTSKPILGISANTIKYMSNGIFPFSTPLSNGVELKPYSSRIYVIALRKRASDINVGAIKLLYTMPTNITLQKEIDSGIFVMFHINQGI